jgi:hypothetical protein
MRRPVGSRDIALTPKNSLAADYAQSFPGAAIFRRDHRPLIFAILLL